MIQEKELVSKVSRRIIPYLFLCYIFNYLDRFNISFAALEMKADLGFGDAVYGLGAGMFFLGYVFFEVPSNLMLEKVGARMWISRIMLTWGVVSCAMMFVKTPFSFYLLRFLLGLSEAGFFPGIILYLTYWIPAKERARTFALFMTSTSLAGVLGGPISAVLLNMRGVEGLQGWQWMFLLEGIPSVLLGVFTFFYLTDEPRKAAWLTGEEREWLHQKLKAESEAKQKRHGFTLSKALLHPRVWHLCLLYFSIIISFYGVAFWLPQIVKNFSGLSNSMVALLSALPYLCASIGMVLTANHSDRNNERRWHVAIPALAGCLGLVLSALFQQDHSWLALLALCMAATGIWSTLGPFWSLPAVFLSGTAAAGGIALINSIGNVGGFVGPYLIGFMKERTNHFESGILILAVSLLGTALLALTIKKEDTQSQD
jgi:D-galactonate transporter